MKKQTFSSKGKKLAKRGLALFLTVAMLSTNNFATIPTLAAEETAATEMTEGAPATQTVTSDANTSVGDTGTGTEGETIGQPIPEAPTEQPDAQPEPETPTEQPIVEEPAVEEPAAEEPVVREAADWTNDASQMNLSIESLLYKEADAEEVQLPVTKDETNVYRADLSTMNLDKLESLKLELGFDIATAMADKQIQPGDTFTYTLPADIMQLADTTEPVAVMNRDVNDNNVELSEQIATYEIKSNVVKVTYMDTINTVDHVIGKILLPINLNKDALSTEQTTETTFALQVNEEQGVNTSCAVVLPQVPKVEEEVTPTEDKTPAADESKKDETVTDETTDTIADEATDKKQDDVDENDTEKENSNLTDTEGETTSFLSKMQSAVMSFFGIQRAASLNGTNQVTSDISLLALYDQDGKKVELTEIMDGAGNTTYSCPEGVTFEQLNSISLSYDFAVTDTDRNIAAGDYISFILPGALKFPAALTGTIKSGSTVIANYDIDEKTREVKIIFTDIVANKNITGIEGGLQLSFGLDRDAINNDPTLEDLTITTSEGNHTLELPSPNKTVDGITKGTPVFDEVNHTLTWDVTVGTNSTGVSLKNIQIVEDPSDDQTITSVTIAGEKVSSTKNDDGTYTIVLPEGLYAPQTVTVVTAVGESYFDFSGEAAQHQAKNNVTMENTPGATTDTVGTNNQAESVRNFDKPSIEKQGTPVNSNVIQYDIVVNDTPKYAIWDAVVNDELPTNLELSEDSTVTLSFDGATGKVEVPANDLRDKGTYTDAASGVVVTYKKMKRQEDIR